MATAGGRCPSLTAGPSSPTRVGQLELGFPSDTMFIYLFHVNLDYSFMST